MLYALVMICVLALPGFLGGAALGAWSAARGPRAAAERRRIRAFERYAEGRAIWMPEFDEDADLEQWRTPIPLDPSRTWDDWEHHREFDLKGATWR